MPNLTAPNNEVQFVTTQFSSGVERENQATLVIAQEHMKIAESASTPEEYCSNGRSAAPFEYGNFLSQFPGSQLKVLDVGVGRGESSVFLAKAGHQVFSVEPSLGFCNLISYVKTKFNLEITPICAVGEDMDQISERNFDLVIFNSSLHHCDDPVKALRNAFHLLKPGGRVFLCSETHLRPWTSKDKWFSRLETHPEETGHYGGNEHIYYNWEYSQMLKSAGFSSIERLPSGLFLNPISRIEMDFKTKKQDLLNSQGHGYLKRLVYYFMMSRLVKFSPIFQALTAISILPAQFWARKL